MWRDASEPPFGDPVRSLSLTPATSWETTRDGGFAWCRQPKVAIPGLSLWRGETSKGEIFAVFWGSAPGVGDGGPAFNCEVFDAESLAHEWARRGGKFVESISGPFSCVVWDSGDDILFGARDPIGIRPLLVYGTGDTRGFLGSARAAWQIPGFAPRLDEGWLVSFLHDTADQGKQAALEGVEYVPPGYSVTITGDGMTVEAFHRWDAVSPTAQSSENVAVETYREALILAVLRNLPPGEVVAVESSGGVDSSAILAVAAASGRTGAQQVHALTYTVFEQEESRVSSVNASFPGLIEKAWLGEDLYSGDVLSAQERAWDAIGYPAEHPNSAAHVLFYDYAQSNGISVLLSGFGGDEGVSSPAFHQVEEFWRRGKVWSAAGATGRQTFASRLKYIARRVFCGDPSKGSGDHYATMVLALSVMTDEALKTTKAEERIVANSTVGGDAKTINGFVLARLTSKQLWARVVESTLIAAQSGVDYRYPLLDRDLVQVYLQTPSTWKRKGQIGRYLHRKAIEDWLPANIVWRTPKEAGKIISQPFHPIDIEGPEPYVDRLIAHLPKRLQGVVDPEKMRALAELTGEREKFYARRILARVDELSRWMNTYGVE